MLAKRTCIDDLQAAGISWEDATALRRISMTLHRWHELECGDSDKYVSMCLVRGEKHKDSLAPRGYVFNHNDDGRPFLEKHFRRYEGGKDTIRYELIPDRERGALKRLAKIMACYPGFASYVQGDPRGCALYILRPGDLNTLESGDGSDISSCYTRGIAVYK